MRFDSKIVLLIIVIIVVIILIYRGYYKTDKERFDNRTKLYIWIGVSVLAVIAVGCLLDSNSSPKSSSNGDGQEYGWGDKIKAKFGSKPKAPKTPRQKPSSAGRKNAGKDGHSVTNITTKTVNRVAGYEKIDISDNY